MSSVVTAYLLRIRKPLLGMGLLGLIAAGGIGVVGPLFNMSSPPSAEIGTAVPSSVVVGHRFTIDISIDNVGTSVVAPLCLDAAFDRSVSVDGVIFQGIDRVPMQGGLACGGSLTGQESINLALTLVPQEPGTLHIRLTPAMARAAIGKSRTDVVNITR